MTAASERTGRDVDEAQVELLVRAALEEDLAGGFDVTSSATVPRDERSAGDFVARADGVVAGLGVAECTLRLASKGAVQAERHVEDGAPVRRGDVLLTAHGPTTALLTAERTALNFLCHLSGIATATRRWADALVGTGARVRDTRKTTPLLRVLEKYAVRCGGGVNHRMSLSDEALIKDNHVLAAGGVARAFQRVRGRFPDLPVQVEVTRLEQIEEALAVGAASILLDNMSTGDMREAVRLVAGRATLEASGGLTLDRAREVGDTGVDYLAVGALTHSAPILDIAFDLRAR
ncbi:MAG TPA: carboxylating nicotinate-nucleotide diphosphorylase [Nocardioidaceae bacterium]|nr:carboxylating nicotinate-nucleotide diphosphorylase [Nocardioidaceae bacterium]